MSAENWLPVVGYEGYYEVSDLGRVRSVDRRVLKANGVTGFFHGRVLALHQNARGYVQLHLYRDGAARWGRVHKMVLEAFVGPRPEGLVACHFDDDKTNNRLENLRWDTQSANTYDRVRNGNDPNRRKTHCANGHPLSGDNLSSRVNKQGWRIRDCRACGREKMRRRRAAGLVKR